jgi:enoyl-[acyl-carrier protein] reductase I
MSMLTGKRALIVGLISRHSIAYGIAAAMQREGAELAFTYQNETVATRVKKLVEKEFDAASCTACDVASDAEIEQLFQTLKEKWGYVDIVVHSVAYAPKDQLAGDYVAATTREGFRIAHDVSSYSFTALAKGARPLMAGRSGALLSLSYLGANRAVPNYNVMGLAKASLEANVRYMASSLGPDRIRVNAISAGPIRTLAATGIQGMSHMLDFHQATAPLRELTSIEQVGNTAAFLCSDLAAGITGEIIHVDGGFHAISAMSE